MINEGSYAASSEATNLMGNANSILKKPSVQPIYCTETGISQRKNISKTDPSQRKGGVSQNTVNPVKPQESVLLYPSSPESYCETFRETCETDETYSAPSKVRVESLFTGFIGFIGGFILELCTARYCNCKILKVSQVSQLICNVKRFGNNE